MSEELNLPKGIPIPGWFRRFLEARANQPGPIIPPPPAAGNHPAAATPLPPPPPRGNTFAKICKDFKAMGGEGLSWNRVLRGSQELAEGNRGIIRHL